MIPILPSVQSVFWSRASESSAPLKFAHPSGVPPWAPRIQVVHELRMPFWIGFSAHDIGRGLVMFDNVATPIDKALARLVPQAVGGRRDELADGDSGCDLMCAMHCLPSVFADVLDTIQAHGWSGPLMAYADDVRAWDPSSARVVAGDDPVVVPGTVRNQLPCKGRGVCCAQTLVIRGPMMDNAAEPIPRSGFSNDVSPAMMPRPDYNDWRRRCQRWFTPMRATR